MANVKIPEAFKKIVKSFSIKPSVLLDFNEKCYKQKVNRSKKVEELMIAFINEDEKSHTF